MFSANTFAEGEIPIRERVYPQPIMQFASPAHRKLLRKLMNQQ
jgi:hypothetical protein